MKDYVFVLLIVMAALYAQSSEKIKINDLHPADIKQSEPDNPHNFPTEVKFNPEIKLQTGTPPVLPALEIEKLKQNLKPQTARKIENIKIRRAGKIKKLSYSRAEAMASYKAMLQKKLAEQELKNMINRGATYKEIEDFKMATEERILQTRYEIMKAFGRPEEIKETEEAIM